MRVPAALFLVAGVLVTTPADTPLRAQAPAPPEGCACGMSGGPMAGPAGPARQGMKGDQGHMADMQVFHYLLAHRAEIRRTVTTLPDGIDTLTESDVPEVAATIKGHVASMYRRVEEQRPIHQRDPLFREIFANADKIVIKAVPTDKGVRVIETSTDPYVASLLHEHAKVLNLFIANGMEEMHKDHPVPPRK